MMHTGKTVKTRSYDDLIKDGDDALSMLNYRPESLYWNHQLEMILGELYKRETR